MEHREWIGGRALTLLSHYYRPDDPVELTAAIGQDWAEVLKSLPRESIQKACIEYVRDNPRRRPTPGAIYELASKHIIRSLKAAPKPVLVEQKPKRMTGEQSNKILKEAGIRPRKFGGANA